MVNRVEFNEGTLYRGMNRIKGTHKDGEAARGWPWWEAVTPEWEGMALSGLGRAVAWERAPRKKL